MTSHVIATAPDRLRSYLLAQGVGFELTEHPVAYTAQEIAAFEHVPGTMMAKVVLAFAGTELLMLVLPASSRVNPVKLSSVLGGREVRLAHEEEFAPRFPDCVAGAMPPFGNLYGLPVYVDLALTGRAAIEFQAGTHRLTMRTRTEDFLRLVRPVVADLADPPG